MTEKKCYYAHYMGHYDTQMEEDDITTLEKMGFEVVNPNTDSIMGAIELIKWRCKEKNTSLNEQSQRIMNYFYDEVIPQCDVLAFRSMHDGKISAGVYSEIIRAQDLYMPVFEIDPPLYHNRCLSVDETRQRLRLGIK